MQTNPVGFHSIQVSTLEGEALERVLGIFVIARLEVLEEEFLLQVHTEYTYAFEPFNQQFINTM